MAGRLAILFSFFVLSTNCLPLEDRVYEYSNDDKKGDAFKNPDEAMNYLVDSYCLPAADIICTAAYNCGCQKYPPFISTEHCKESLIERCKNRVVSLKEVFSSGRVVISIPDIEGCIKHIKKVENSCELPDEKKLDGLCKSMIYDRAEIGERCYYEICSKGNGICRDGVCTPLPSENEPCEGLCSGESICIDGICRMSVVENGECNNDSYCDLGLVCHNGRCSYMNQNPATCHTTEECSWGYVCRGNVCIRAEDLCISKDTCGNRNECIILPDLRCKPLSTEGEICNNSLECEEGLYCDKGVCHKAPDKGENCADGIYCGKSLICSITDNLCIEPPVKGENCGLSREGFMVCDEGYSCIEGVCKDIPNTGMECGSDFKCVEGAGCDFKDNGSFCDSLRDEGEPCLNDHICKSQYYCNFEENKCRRRLDRGSSCKYGNECLNGLTCLPDSRGNYICSPIPDLDQPCLDKCKSGLVCKNVTSEGICLPSICGIVR